MVSGTKEKDLEIAIEKALTGTWRENMENKLGEPKAEYRAIMVLSWHFHKILMHSLRLTRVCFGNSCKPVKRQNLPVFNS